MSMPSALAALDRKARFRREVEQRRDAAHVVGGKELSVDAVDLHGVGGACRDFHLGLAVRHHDHAALRQHDVVIEVFRQALVEPKREIVERHTLRIEVVRAHDRGVAPGVAAADPAFFEHRHAGEPVVLCQVVGRRQAVTAATYH